MGMPPELSEQEISLFLFKALHPGSASSTDGFASLAQPQSGVSLKCAAVLMPLLWQAGKWHLLFTRRTDMVESHKGQVSFPGGECDDQEATAEETALREAHEEIGFRPSDVRVIGRLNDIVTITHYRVTPVVGVIPCSYHFQLSEHEVSRVFTIPLGWLVQRENWDERFLDLDGLPQAWPVIMYHPYDGEILWGASARMTHTFLRVLGLIAEEEHHAI
jgi:8-oxo-dGTP pyrophosphatase MutT (NUDIX family)